MEILVWVGGRSPFHPPPVPEIIRFGPFMHREILEWEKQYTDSLALIESTLTQEINALGGTSAEDTRSIDGLNRELAVRAQLIQKKSSEIQQASEVADRFYGVDPLSLSHQQRMHKVSEQMMRARTVSDVHKFAQRSHEAAYRRSFAKAGLARLVQETSVLQARLAEVQQEREQARQAEQERSHVAAHVLKSLDGAAARLAQAAIPSRKQSLAQAAARANERARTEADERASESTTTERVANSFHYSGAASASSAQLVTASGRIIAAEGGATALQSAVRSAVATLAENLAKASSGMMVGISALVYSPKLGDGELSSRYSFSIPLSELKVPAPSEFKTGAVRIPVRLDFRVSTADQVEIVAVATDLLSESSSLRIIAAKYDSERKVYTASTPDVPGRNLLWTPIVEPGNSTTARPVHSVPVPVYEGATLVPLEGRVDIYPELTDVEIDDYIFVFPAESGLPPLYVVFRSPRNMPGTVSGEGQPVQGGWLSNSPDRNGAPVPAWIADQLRGMKFNNFSRFREAFWRLVAADEVLKKQFLPMDIARMKQGYAPLVPEGQSSGARQVFEIHHVEFISNGGAVYDVDNLMIMTPKSHIKLHAEVKRG